VDIHHLKGNAVKAFILLWVAIAYLLFVPLSPLWAQDVDIDFIAPNIEYRPFVQAVYSSKQIEIAVKITDDRGVQEANLFYRPAGKEGFLKIKMTASSDDIYSAVISGEEVFEPRMDYYFEATDRSGNTMSKGSISSPLAVSVVAAIPIPPPVDLTKKEDVIVDISPAEESFPMGTKIESVERARPWYKKWWVWTIVAGVAGVAASESGGSGDSGDSGQAVGGSSSGTIIISGPPPP